MKKEYYMFIKKFHGELDFTNLPEVVILEADSHFHSVQLFLDMGGYLDSEKSSNWSPPNKPISWKKVRRIIKLNTDMSILLVVGDGKTAYFEHGREDWFLSFS